ncbi:MerR family transcriptional regulator [Actinokineospora diospyrosa]|uniref:DNA-binding transcriptional regulator, MerR family n=1 Tax=Actinokineospora diospyrosa TaxID=103728 RepID=A0ABT1IBZ7_9PSEU|nr:MerR family transcriptional regulator [Actinokineospora diospyrosa]MCP2270155.1 DNA-binding transcriptional regulator, MerR family [Actinokineospora diospyrosa]
MRATNRGDLDSAYRLIDTTHLALHTERDTHTKVAAALADTTPTPLHGPPLTTSELARRLGLHPATLRTWEAEGILHPTRSPTTGHRQYTPTTIRDAEIAHQLRQGGYPLTRIAQFIDSLRTVGDTTTLTTFLTAWQTRLTTRSRNLLTAAAHLDAYLTLLDQ